MIRNFEGPSSSEWPPVINRRLWKGIDRIVQGVEPVAEGDDREVENVVVCFAGDGLLGVRFEMSTWSAATGEMRSVLAVFDTETGRRVK